MKFSISNFRFSIVAVVVSLLLVHGVSAQTKAASPSATTAPTKAASGAASLVEKEIQNLKEKIATKVAELRKKSQKGVSGVITEAGTSSFKIKTANDDEYQIKIDSTLTKIYVITGASKKDAKAADLKKGLYVIVSGPTVDKTITANVIYQDEQFLVKSGKITEVNTDDIYVKVLTTEKDTVTLDVEISTKLQMVDSKTLDVDTTKLAKLKEGDTIHFVAKKNATQKEAARYEAVKVLVVPQEYFIK